MLLISDVNEFRTNVAYKEEIRESVIGVNLLAFCYMVSAEGTFDTEWLRECRGIVFNSDTGRVAGRPLHKFFNVGERESTRVENVDWSKVVRVMDKRDGSMIHTVKTYDGFGLKSKKTFDSDVAVAAAKWVAAHPEYTAFCKYLISRNQTGIFEYTAPDSRIVLAYSEPEMKLLHVRDNVTGEYSSRTDLIEMCEEFGVMYVDEVEEFFDEVDRSYGYSLCYSFNIKRMLEAAKTREGVEGWVVQFADGNMMKVKTDWYMMRHRAMTFLRERDIAQAVLDESLDDLKSLLVGEAVDISEILEIERQVLHDIREIIMTVEMLYNSACALDRKSFAMKYQGTEYFGLLMAKYIGREPEYKHYFERNILKDKFSLRQLVLIPSTAETE